MIDGPYSFHVEHKITPRCPVFGVCGGCQLQHLSYDAQLRLKESRLRELFACERDLSSLEILPMIPAESPWHYRCRVQLHQSATGEIGFFSEATHQLVPIESCPIAHPKINEAITGLRRLPPPADHRLSLVWDEVRQTVHHYRDDAENIFFTQVNPEQNRVLQKQVMAWIAPKKDMTILELYAGAGNFTIPLAEKGARVTAVEASLQAVEQGHVRGKSLKIDWMAMGVRQALKVLASSHCRDALSASEERRMQCVSTAKRFEICLLDPPRAGLKDCASLLETFNFERLFYVSCNPEALIRDLKILTSKSRYRVTRLLPIDFFPQTTHVEVLCELVSTNPSKPSAKLRPIRF